LGYIYFDNVMVKGYFIYMTNVPGLPGFEPVEDVEATLVGALQAIHSPSKEQRDGSDLTAGRIIGQQRLMERESEIEVSGRLSPSLMPG
jgi:hypothetical protein